MKRLLLAAALTAAATAAAAAAPTAPAPPEDAPEVPELPPSYQGERVEPEVTIIETERDVIYEYRVRGQLYMVRVQPQIGPPYFLLDTNGDGQLDSQQSDPRNIAIPQWVLFSW